MKRLLSYLILAATIAFAVSPAFTNPFSGFEANQLPIPQIDPPIQPAGYAFAIWGIIYAWLFISACFGVWKRADASDWHRARVPLLFSLTLGIPWLAIANASAPWATVTIILMALSAVASMISAPARDRWFFQAPVAIYAGWLTAASCVSIGSTMAGFGILTGAFGWALIGISLGLTLSLLAFRLRPSTPEYLLTVVWALIGIVVANGTELISVSSFAGIGVLVLLAVIFRVRRSPGLLNQMIRKSLEVTQQ